ncbi:MAG: glucan biosynthesis protein [Caulobacterales bacterium]
MWLSDKTVASAAVVFSADTVAALARRLSLKAFAPDPAQLPDSLAEIDYDTYRAIRFRPDRALWANTGSPYQAQFFHRGFYFKEEVELFEVAGDQAKLIEYHPDQFTFENGFDPTGLPADLGFAGFRMHGRLNSPDVIDELLVFLGASYFRALGKGNVYGLSARGLALNTGGAGGEEFPRFSKFWLERPAQGATSFTVHALLDSPSLTGAYTFKITPGDDTVMEVDARLFPRVAIDKMGVAPLTSMFLFSPGDRRRFDDFRQGVHDSDGLLIWNGIDERLWRPLNNPAQLQESEFVDEGLRGFGLMQRARQANDYADYESRFEDRPSVWIEPIGNWGTGSVHLFELSSDLETNDNIVAFWRPAKPWKAGSEKRLRYRIHWGADPAPAGPALRVVDTRTGRGGPAHAPSDAARTYAITYSGAPYSVDLKPEVSASGGEVSNIVLTPRPQGDGARLTFELTPGAASVVDLRANLVREGALSSEIWLNRWTL